jgi:chaperonin cofactor prefoldin
MIAMIVLTTAVRSNGQDGLPEVFKQQPVSEQLKYLEEHTRIYENFRAIREDMYRTITKNVTDTLNNAKKRINSLISQTETLTGRIDSINVILEASNNHLEKITRTKNSLNVLGLEVNKNTYNTIMWSILGILILILVIGYLTFKQNHYTTVKTKKELNDLFVEFEEYKKKTRLEREKTTMEHFNEIKKLKANLPGSRGM